MKISNLLEKDLRIVEKKKLWFSIPAAIVLFAVIMAIVFQFTLGSAFNIGMDFSGGYTMNVKLGTNLTSSNKDDYVKLIEDVTENLSDSEGEKYGLKDFVKHYPNQLSGGMRQRVALIRTLALNPDVLLLDEPFSALDFQTRLQVCDDVHAIIKSEGKTAVLVTHDISEAISMSDRIAILTSRPATLKRIHETNLQNVKTPLLRREAPTFAKQFETLWKEVKNDEK